MGDRGLWVFERAVDRVESVVEEVVAGYVASYVGRAFRRHEIRPPRPLPGIAWSIDGDIVVEFVHRGSAPDQLLVHDIALVDDLKRRLRTRHLDVTYVAME